MVHVLQVRLFSSRDLSKALSADDVWAVVGSSGDLIPLARRSNNISLTVPVSGTALWADLWTVPKGAVGGSSMLGPSPLLPALFEFGLMPKRVQRKGGLQAGASPLQLPELHDVLHGKQPAAASADSHTLKFDELPAKNILSRSEFLLPLDSESTAMYDDLLAV